MSTSGIVASGGGKVIVKGKCTVVSSVEGKKLTEVHAGNSTGNPDQSCGLVIGEDGEMYVATGGCMMHVVGEDFVPGTISSVSDEELKTKPFKTVVVNNGVEFDENLPCIESFMDGPRVFRVRTAKGVFRVEANRVYHAGSPFIVDGIKHAIGEAPGGISSSTGGLLDWTSAFFICAAAFALIFYGTK